MLTNLRTTAVALVCALTLLAGTASAAFAQPNNKQTGLVNVNLQDIAAAIPVSVAVPIGVAANVCNLSVAAVAALSAAGGECDAESNTMALSQAMGEAVAGGGGGGGGGGANNEQTGLVNVNVQDLALALPVSVALPIGIAANVCNVSVALLLAGSAAGGACDATTDASAESIAQAIARASGR